MLDVFPGYDDNAFRIHFFGDEIEEIEQFDPTTNHVLDHYESLNIYPANMFVTSPDILQKAIWNIQQDLVKQVEFFEASGKPLEAKRLKERTEFDLEMIRELGYCSGIENYSRYLDGREPGTRPFCLIDYFPKDFLMVIDESHVTVSQVHAMYGGDRSRKENLVEYGFRLPAAMDNRPLKFEEFEALQNQVIYVRATPAAPTNTRRVHRAGDTPHRIARPRNRSAPQSKSDRWFGRGNTTAHRKRRAYISNHPYQANGRRAYQIPHSHWH